jgi:1-acyl-sn-glycerol-3-phosphate acyltransferase
VIPHDPDALDARDPAWVSRLAGFSWRVLRPWHRAEFLGVERVPEGPALYVGNHNAGTMTIDTWLALGALHRVKGLDAVPYALGHDAVMRLPVPGRWLQKVGGIRADPENAKRLLASGRSLLVYPGGDLEAMRPWRDRDRIVFGGRRGYVRLALEARVPIVPVVAAGAHGAFLVLSDLRWLARLLGTDRWARMKVFPATLTFPWGLTFGPAPPYVPFPTKVIVEVLEPLRFDPDGPEAARDEGYVASCAARVEGAMQEALTRLSERRRKTRWRLSPRDGRASPEPRPTRGRPSRS